MYGTSIEGHRVFLLRDSNQKKGRTGQQRHAHDAVGAPPHARFSPEQRQDVDPPASLAADRRSGPARRRLVAERLGDGHPPRRKQHALLVIDKTLTGRTREAARVAGAFPSV